MTDPVFKIHLSSRESAIDLLLELSRAVAENDHRYAERLAARIIKDVKRDWIVGA